MKAELRKLSLEYRENIDIKKVSKEICNVIKTSEFYKQALNIGIFYPLSKEINLLDLLNNKDKKFYLPKVINNDMEFYYYDKNIELKAGKYDILEPQNSYKSDKNDLDLIIAPCLAVDKNGYRLGWGKGYYDKYLKNYKGIVACPIPEQLIFDDITPEIHDQKIDIITTEKRIIKI